MSVAPERVEQDGHHVGVRVPALLAHEIGGGRRGRQLRARELLVDGDVVEEGHHDGTQRGLERGVEDLEGVGASRRDLDALADEADGLGRVAQLEDPKHAPETPERAEVDRLVEERRGELGLGALPAGDDVQRLGDLPLEQGTHVGEGLGRALERLAQP